METKIDTDVAHVTRRPNWDTTFNVKRSKVCYWCLK